VSGSHVFPTRWPPQCSCVFIEISFDSNGQSIVDYMIASHSIFYDVEHFIVHSPVEFSDHCLISVYMKSASEQKTVI
jgi:hypothetical protein